MEEEFKHVGGLLRLIADDFAGCRQGDKMGVKMDGRTVAEFVHVLRGLVTIIETMVGDYERLRQFEARLVQQQRLLVGRAVMQGADVVMLPRREMNAHVRPFGGGDAA